MRNWSDEQELIIDIATRGARESVRSSGGADLLELLGVGYQFEPGQISMSRVCVIGDNEVLSTILQAAPAHRLHPGFALDALALLSPSHVVVQESFVLSSRWRRMLDFQQRPRRVLESVETYCRQGDAILWLIADRDPFRPPILWRYGEFLPNLRTRSLLLDMECPDVLLDQMQCLSMRLMERKRS